MKAVGLDNWSRFVAKAQTRAHFKATLAAIQTSRQPPDIGKDAIKPLSFSAIMVGLGAAIAAEVEVNFNWRRSPSRRGPPPRCCARRPALRSRSRPFAGG
jgi:hypothetical protein